MQVNRIKAKKYLCIILDYSTIGQMKITMLDYINEILGTSEKADPMGGGTRSSAAEDIVF